MSFSVKATFESGGRECIDLLEFCVLSINCDLLFSYLLRDFRSRATAIAAVTLFDLFCDAQAPAKLSVTASLPPKDRRLEHQIATFRASDGDVPDSGPPAPTLALPPRYLFDSLETQLFAGEDSQREIVERTYDPKRTPHQNLPGGTLSAAQRSFVEYVWQPRVRPQLVSAGFWRIASIA